VTDRIGELEYAAAVRGALSESGRDLRDDVARALLPFLTANDAAVVAAATAVLKTISNASETADVMTELAELAAAGESKAAEIADHVLVALTPADIGGPTPGCPPLSVLVAAGRDEARLPATALGHVDTCTYCRETIAAASAPVNELESVQPPPLRALESAREIMLMTLERAFSGFVPSEFSPALTRNAGRGAVADDVGATQRASGLLQNEELWTLGLGSSYEYRVLAGDKKGTITIIVDFEPLDPAVAVDAVVQLVPLAGETVAQSTLRGRGRVRRVSFRDLELADEVWGSLAVSVADRGRER
jgi:hypothetical protein